MGLKIFEIEFTNPNKHFIAGQTVFGNIIVDVDQIGMKIQELGLRLFGKAEVSWVASKNKTENCSRPKTSATPEIRISHTKDNKMNEKVLSNEERYFDRRHTILEKRGSDDLVVPVGGNKYPFEISLPLGIPSSFEGDYGSVKYFLEATIKRSTDQYDHTCKSQLYVTGILDLNCDPQAQIEKPEVSHEEHLCCLCCKSGPIGFNFGVLGSAGVVPGDNIQFLADIYNMSDTPEVLMKLKLVQMTTYHVHQECKVVRQELLKLQGPSVCRGGAGTWSGESIQIPQSIPPTRLAGRCSLISLDYTLEISVETPRGKKVTARLPIIVGTVPFGKKVQDLINTASTTNF